MNLIISTDNQTITLMDGKKQLISATGPSSHMAFVALEMGRHVGLYQKLAEGVDTSVMEESYRIEKTFKQMELAHAK